MIQFKNKYDWEGGKSIKKKIGQSGMNAIEDERR